MSSQQLQKDLKSNALVQAHVESLHDIIEELRRDKVKLTMQSRKQQSTILELEKKLVESRKAPKELKIQVDHLTYKLAALTKRCEEDTHRLRTRISELETHVTSVPHHHVNLSRTEQLASEKDSCLSSSIADSEYKLLRSKLKIAAVHIKKLTGEKQQLINLCNKLRAGSRGDAAPSETPRRSLALQKMDNRLVELQKLHYELEKQALLERRLRDKAQTAQPEREHPVHRDSPVLSRRTSDRPETTESNADNTPNRHDASSIQIVSAADDRFVMSRRTAPKLQESSSQTTFREAWSGHTGADAGVVSARRPDAPPLDVLHSMSSGAGESLGEVWALLDQTRLSESAELSTDVIRPPDRQTGLAVQGQAQRFESRSKPNDRFVVSQPPARKLKPKVRNYNIRNDQHAVIS